MLDLCIDDPLMQKMVYDGFVFFFEEYDGFVLGGLLNEKYVK
jgi:hypothetical protein